MGGKIREISKQTIRTAEKRLSQKTQRTDGCWEWKGVKFWTGYGMMTIGSRKDGTRRNAGAHRIALAVAMGRDILPGMQVCHTCNNRACVNPDHLYECTPAENTRDRMKSDSERRRCQEWGRSTWGSNNYNAKLTDADVCAIRKAVSQGVMRKTMAERYGVAKRTIYRIVNKVTWTQVDCD